MWVPKARAAMVYDEMSMAAWMAPTRTLRARGEEEAKKWLGGGLSLAC